MKLPAGKKVPYGWIVIAMGLPALAMACAQISDDDLGMVSSALSDGGADGSADASDAGLDGSADASDAGLRCVYMRADCSGGMGLCSTARLEAPCPDPNGCLMGYQVVQPTRCSFYPEVACTPAEYQLNPKCFEVTSSDGGPAQCMTRFRDCEFVGYECRVRSGTVPCGGDASVPCTQRTGARFAISCQETISGCFPSMNPENPDAATSCYWTSAAPAPIND